MQIRLHRAEHIQPSPDISHQLQGLKVCCVDDNETNRMVLYHYAHGWGMEPLLAKNGQEGLEILREQFRQGAPCDMAILDMNMPEMNGMDLAHAIKADPELHSLPLVLLTSSGLRGDAARSRDVGFGAYLSKPVRKTDLQVCLEMLMGRSTQTDAMGASTSKGVSEAEGVSCQSVSGHILVVDDHVVNQQLAQMMLARLGHRIDVVGNGLEALEAVRRIPYDLVFMDCQMPEMDGYEATKKIREAESLKREALGEKDEMGKAISPDALPLTNDGIRRLTIVAMTANAMKGDREKCLAAGMDDYISKPIKHEDLALLVVKWLPLHDNTPLKFEEGALVSRNSEDVPAHAKSEDLLSSIGEGQPVEPVLSPQLVQDWRAAGGNAFVVKLVDQFIHDATVCVEEIQIALESQCANEIREAAHGLKGMAANMGLNQLATLAHLMETHGRERNFLNIAPLFETMQKEFARVHTSLQQLLNQEQTLF